MKIQRCKGFRDLSGLDMKKFRLIEDAFRGVCLSWGYQEVRTPTLEYMHLFTSTGTFTPSLLNKVYSFLIGMVGVANELFSDLTVQFR
jgi:histidyl-tRNA synthetase